MSDNEFKLRKALNHAFTQGVMAGIDRSKVLDAEEGRDARGAKLNALLNATTPEMQRNTKNLLAWLKRST